jgi:dihydroorotate dehydrogenase
MAPALLPAPAGIVPIHEFGLRSCLLSPTGSLGTWQFETLIYRALFKTVLSRFDPESTHRFAGGVMRLLVAIPGIEHLMAWIFKPRDPAIAVEALGLKFSTPLGVAAGVDKNATWFRGLSALGFGFVEVGTVTAEAQPGNPGRRVTRLPRDRALLNRMGFPNDGAAVISRRLAKRGASIVGVNIGKTMRVDIESAIADYEASTHLLAANADYLVINVSSPNTPGLVGMQTSGRLRELVGRVQSEVDNIAPGLPILVKIGPDLADSQLDQIAELTLDLKLDGIIAVNTTTHTDLAAASVEQIERLTHRGGLSGAPLKARSLEILKRLYAKTEGEVVLISVGGIETPEDAWQRILAGASLLQAHTGFVYGGPLWPSRLNRGIARCLRASPWTVIEDAVGKGAESRAVSKPADQPSGAPAVLL